MIYSKVYFIKIKLANVYWEYFQISNIQHINIMFLSGRHNVDRTTDSTSDTIGYV